MVSNEVTGNRKIVGNTIIVPFYNDFPNSPRESEFGSMVYQKGRNEPFSDKEIQDELIREFGSDYDSEEMYNYICENKEPFILLPLYVYVHSAISINTDISERKYTFSEKRKPDGYFYITENQLREIYSIEGEISQEDIVKCLKSMEAQVEEFSNYTNGENYIIERYILDEYTLQKIENGLKIEKICLDYLQKEEDNVWVTGYSEMLEELEEMSSQKEESIPLEATDIRYDAIFFKINDRKDTITFDIGYFPIGKYDIDILISEAKALFKNEYPDTFNEYKILEINKAETI